MTLDNFETVWLPFKKVLMTPEMAREILQDHNEGNRHLSRASEKYAAEMKAGNWQQYSPACVMMWDETKEHLDDGQHRCKAVILANESQGFLFFETHGKTFIADRGRVRSVEDNMRLRGIDPKIANRRTREMANFYLNIIADKNNPSDKEVEDFMVKYHENIEKAVSISEGKGPEIKTKRTAVKFALFCALEAGVDEATLRDFIKTVNTGHWREEWETPALRLNTTLKETKAGNRDERRKQAYATDNAIKDYVAKQKRTQKYSNAKPYYIALFDAKQKKCP